MTALIADKKRTLTPFEKTLSDEKLLSELNKIMHDDAFDDCQMHHSIMQQMPNLAQFEEDRKENIRCRSKNMPATILQLYENPILSREQESHQFRKYNFLKYKAKQSIDTAPHQVSQYLKDAIEIKHFIANCNTRLAMNIAKKHAEATKQNHRFWDIVSEAYLGIMRSVQCFEFNRNIKFSTYATWAIRNNLKFDNIEECKYKEHYVSWSDDAYNEPTREDNTAEITDRQAFICNVINQLLNRIHKKNADAIRRYMLTDSSLSMVAVDLNISKERVRQLNFEGIEKMRIMIERGEVSLNGLIQEFTND